MRWSSSRGVLAALMALLVTSACTERFQPGSRYGACMEDAGYELGEYTVFFADEAGDLILRAVIDDPPPSEQTPEMLAQSEECVLQVNGGVRATTVPVVTTLPEGLAGVFTVCAREAGYEVHDVEIEVRGDGGVTIGHSGEALPPEVAEECHREVEEQHNRP